MLFKRIVLALSSLGLLGLALFGSAIVVNALVIGIITVMGLVLLMAKLPVRVRTFMLNHPLPTDIVLSVICFVLYGSGGTITGLAAGSVAAFMVSLVVMFMSEFAKRRNSVEVYRGR